MKVVDYPHAERAAYLSGTFKQALTLGIEAVVRHHLRSGQDVNSRDDKGQTPLIIAAAKGHAKICSILLEAGANADLRDSSGSTALEAAVIHRKSNVWELLQRILKERPHVKPDLRSSAPPSAPPSMPLPPPEAAPVVIMTLDIDDDVIDVSRWQPEVDLAPPPQDHLILPEVRITQRDLGEHIPIDLDEDWSDVEIILPELIARRRRRRDNEEEARWLADASSLALIALRDGEVAESLISNITPAVGAEGDEEGMVDYDAMLRVTLGDLGVRIGEDNNSRLIFDGPDDESEERYNLELGEATQFLQTCLERREEPLTHHMTALSRTKVLSPEDDQAIGRAMEEGTSVAFTAIASSDVAMSVVLETIDKIEQRKVGWDSAITDDPAYMEADETPGDDMSDVLEGFEQEETVQHVPLPAALVARIASVRQGYADLQTAASWQVPALRKELGICIQALGLRENLMDRLRSVVEHREPDQTIRESLSAGLRKTRTAKEKLFASNQKLVFWIARKYRNRGLPLMDLVQEGSLGLMKAVEKFDYSRGYKLSTYATWWIRQAISRAIADQSRLIRVPVHMVEVVNRARWAIQEHEALHGHEPTALELAAKLSVSDAKAALVLGLLNDFEPFDDADASGNTLSNLLVDPALSPEEAILQQSRKLVIRKELANLPSRQRNIICLRFGIGQESEHTLEEVGQQYGVTRERIRQIEAKALGHLRHPMRLRTLRQLM